MLAGAISAMVESVSLPLGIGNRERVFPQAAGLTLHRWLFTIDQLTPLEM